MDTTYYKEVLFPIIVSSGDYCWGPGKDGSTNCICEHFDNYYGNPKCSLGIRDLKYDDDMRVKKPDMCLNLKEVQSG